MAIDRGFVERNRAQTERIRALVAGLSDADLLRPVGEHWTVGVALAHIAFWDGRVLAVLDASERKGEVSAQQIDIIVNDISLPLWAAIPPREAGRIAIANAEMLDQRLEALAPELLEQIAVYNVRYVERARHRGEHLDEIDAALAAALKG
ncbi:MAG: maleylpyruvate isomerase N-terminal domain-containing protein [Anaerolineae bacterium]|nr:maleylpyruvate isomerase N-terminal domain-containing protein [Anaerolineae bacterium]